ncbi:hypothetical protein PH5382_02049 [Phaeobacter sp. CECT 5382]|nr:hypothetical protein PH5382_02049 [Phaeobacter sp. CECT 5382]
MQFPPMCTSWVAANKPVFTLSFKIEGPLQLERPFLRVTGKSLTWRLFSQQENFFVKLDQGQGFTAHYLIN